VLAALLFLISVAPGPAQAALQRLNVVAGNSAADAEFVRQLELLREPGEQLKVVKVPAGGLAAAPAAAVSLAVDGEDAQQAANAGVRTRGLRGGGGAGAAPEPATAITVAVGVEAARSAVAQSGGEPLLLTMLSQGEYEALKASAGLSEARRRVGVLLRDPPVATQLALMAAALPAGSRRLGVVAAAQSGTQLRALEDAARPDWTLKVGTAADVQAIGAALRDVLPACDALLLLPDAIGDDPAATAAVLRMAAGAGVPVFGANDAMVRAGALAATLSDPEEMALQAHALGRRLADGSGDPVLVEAARPTGVSVNGNVARSLGLRLPSREELTQRVTAVR